MRNLRNKKRLTSLAVVFALVFMTGAAFALSPGSLDIVGTVNITAPEDMYVVWETAETDDTGGPAQPFVSSWGVDRSEATIVGTRGRTDQRIEWDIVFMAPNEGWDGAVGEASVQLTATATNNSPFQDANITAATVTWSVPAADFGLDIDVDYDDFIGFLAAGDTTDELFVEVTWDGTVPIGFFDDDDIDPEDEVFATTLTITFAYDPV